MIPVIDEAIIQFNIDEVIDTKYKNLLQNQLRYIKKDWNIIKESANKLYRLLFKPLSERTEYERKICERCCNLQNLEKIYKQFST